MYHSAKLEDFMIISFSDQDLQRMPTRLREEILAYASELAERAVARSDWQTGDSSSEFSFARPPLGARHPRDLVSFTREQAVAFLKILEGADSSSWGVLGQFVREDPEHNKMDPSGLAGILGFKDEKTGEWDPWLVSPFLKKITHAVRRFTGNKNAGWYTIDLQGAFYLDPKTLDALRYAFAKWEEDPMAQMAATSKKSPSR